MKFKIFRYNTVSSTNDVAIDLIKKKKYERGFVYALAQKKGRGRHGNKWISKKHIHDSIKFYGDCDYSRYLQKITSNK